MNGGKRGWKEDVHTVVVSELLVELPTVGTLGTLIDKGNFKEGGIFTLMATCGGARGRISQRNVIVALDAREKTSSTLQPGA